MVKRLIIAILVLALAVVCFMSLPEKVFRPLGLSYLDNKAEDYYNGTMKNALAAYAVARAINAGVSVIQDTHIEISPAGLGVSLALGQILDPVNDIIERFSWIMLVSLSSLAIQRVILEIGQHVGLGTLLAFGLSILALSYLLPYKIEYILRNIALKIVVLSISIRMVIPLVGYVGVEVYSMFLNTVYDESIKELKIFESSVSSIQTVTDGSISEADEGWWDKLKSEFGNVTQIATLKEILTKIKSMVEDQVRYIINLLMVFIIQTIIIPITVLLFMKYIASSLYNTVAPFQGTLVRSKSSAE